LPEPVSEKKVLKLSSPTPIVLSLGIWPSGWMPAKTAFKGTSGWIRAKIKI
jgi:hypothetical protein